MSRCSSCLPLPPEAQSSSPSTSYSVPPIAISNFISRVHPLVKRCKVPLQYIFPTFLQLYFFLHTSTDTFIVVFISFIFQLYSPPSGTGFSDILFFWLVSSSSRDIYYLCCEKASSQLFFCVYFVRLLLYFICLFYLYFRISFVHFICLFLYIFVYFSLPYICLSLIPTCMIYSFSIIFNVIFFSLSYSSTNIIFFSALPCSSGVHYHHLRLTCLFVGHGVCAIHLNIILKFL